jgi:single-strand DNA-binding protein
MAGLNMNHISGNLVADPELTYTASGTAKLKGRVAFDQPGRASDGSFQQETGYANFVTFGKRAESLAKHLRKGTKVAVSGPVRQSRFQDKNTGRMRTGEEEIEIVDIDFNNRGPRPGTVPMADGTELLLAAN